jgi:hypothetical protein
MTKGTQIDGDEDARCDRAERELAPSSRSAASASQIIPFPRPHIAASVGLGAGDDPLSSPASFESLGAVTQAVVMRLANKRLRLKVQVQTTEGTE